MIAALDAAGVPAGRIYTVKDIAHDPHYKARDMLIEQTLGSGECVLVPGVIPKLSRTPGLIRSAAPKLGEHTLSILKEIGLSTEQIKALSDKGILGNKGEELL